jgi:hypothetical protein
MYLTYSIGEVVAASFVVLSVIGLIAISIANSRSKDKDA